MPRLVFVQSGGLSVDDHVRAVPSRSQSTHTSPPISCTTSQSTFSHIQCIHSQHTSHCTHGSFIPSGREQQTSVRLASTDGAARRARLLAADRRCPLAVARFVSPSF